MPDGLEGLEAYDLRVSVNIKGHLTIIMMGSFEKEIQEGMLIVQMMIAIMLIFDAEKVHEVSEEEECNESLVASNECGNNDGSDADELLNRMKYLHYADAGDDDGKLTKNENKMDSHPCITDQLVIDFKANPTMHAGNTQKLIMERYGIFFQSAIEEFVMCIAIGTLLLNIQVYTKRHPQMQQVQAVGHNSRSHREGNVLKIRRGKDKPRKSKASKKGRVSRPSKVDENPSKQARTTQATSSQPIIATTSSSHPKIARTSSSQPIRGQPSVSRQIRS
ncbi:hypothetical protein Cgig2_006627 [Carnegiea gigantea]|uniref:Uncharacterized protein n=1 Tax=Carnegiea gigantea TaxID=171969 RepID=A0A9Q1GN03_9CARY|nr:hypothetical protein Cgig2_006627 [Carnegiea gigantea]